MYYDMEQLALMGAMYMAGNLTDEEYRSAAAIAIWLVTIEHADRGEMDYAISADFIARYLSMVAEERLTKR